MMENVMAIANLRLMTSRIWPTLYAPWTPLGRKSVPGIRVPAENRLVIVSIVINLKDFHYENTCMCTVKNTRRKTAFIFH